MLKQIVGGVVTVAIGGTVFAVHQSDVTKNFANNTGMSQQQADNYVKNAQGNLVSFNNVGQGFVSDGNKVLTYSTQIDCTNYTYPWESASVSCAEGITELNKLGNDEVQLGNCYSALDTNLGSATKSKISECVTDIDTTNSDYDQPIASQILTNSDITDFKNSNTYNKSVLQAALQSK